MEEQKLAAAEKVFRVALRCIENIWEFIEAELGQEVPRGAHKPGGVPLGMPLELVAPSWLVRSSPEPCRVSSGPEKTNPNFFLRLDSV